MWEVMAALAALGAVFLWMRGEKIRSGLETELEKQRGENLRQKKELEQVLGMSAGEKEQEAAREKKLSASALSLHLYSQLAEEEARTAFQKEIAGKLLEESEKILRLLGREIQGSSGNPGRNRENT